MPVLITSQCIQIGLEEENASSWDVHWFPVIWGVWKDTAYESLGTVSKWQLPNSGLFQMKYEIRSLACITASHISLSWNDPSKWVSSEMSNRENLHMTTLSKSSNLSLSLALISDSVSGYL